ncbi:MAG: diacylglycerol kinase family lipid kinase [Mangrovimonas sp.]|nr:diacylglycerol kinase family lipid kinase [Mangrovimonas sp.]
MKHIHFIINPISGSGQNNIDLNFLSDNFPRDSYDLKIKYTTHKFHAVQLSKDSIEEGADIIVACGGDGTINEVSSSLVNSKVALGIIPMGSGNGLANHLKIPQDLKKAIALIKNESYTFIDVGQCNDFYFFSNCGWGFDSEVLKVYENSGSRKFSSYFLSTIRAFKAYRYEFISKVSYENHIFSCKPFMLFVSNSNQMGYGVGLTPTAKLNDGLLDLVVIPELPKRKIMLLGLKILFKQHKKIKKFLQLKIKSIETEFLISNPSFFQIDGEIKPFETNKASVKVLEKALKVIVKA